MNVYAILYIKTTQLVLNSPNSSINLKVNYGNYEKIQEINFVKKFALISEF